MKGLKIMQKKTYNRKEIFEKINNFEEHLKKIESYGLINNSALTSLLKITKELAEENKALKESINVLTGMNTGNVGEAPGCQFFMLKSYRGTPVIFKDGQKFSDDAMKNVSVYWNWDDPNIEVNIEH